MAGMDQAGRFLSPGRVYAALVLVGACLLAGCGLAMAERQAGDAEETAGVESATE